MNHVIEPLTDASELAHAYESVLAPSFPPTELVPVDVFVAGGTTGHLDVLVARPDGGGEPLGVIVGERHGDGVLVDWLAVSGAMRGGGVGGALIEAGLRRWLDGGALVVLGEVERPDRFGTHPRYGDPERRLAFYDRLGATALDVPYYQPPIAEGMPRLPGLLLVVLAAADPAPAPRILSQAEADAVREVLAATMGEPEPGDAETQRVFAAVDDTAGVRLLPLAQYQRVPLSR